MAQLKGPGAMTGVNLVVKTFDNNVTRNGKTQYLDVQVDARDQRAPGQNNLHLISERVDKDDGEVRYNNGAPYSTRQFDTIRQAAGPNIEPIMNKDNEQIGAVFGVKADLMPSSKGNGLIINTKTVKPSDFKVDGTTLDAQFASMTAAKEAKQAQAPAVGDPAPAAQAEQSAELEPQVG